MEYSEVMNKTYQSPAVLFLFVLLDILMSHEVKVDVRLLRFLFMKELMCGSVLVYK